jgi:hypothetical protein
MLREAEMSSVRQSAEDVRSARQGDSASAVVLEQFSTRLPPEILTRLRVAAPQLGLRQSDITASAIDRFLRRRGF